MKLVTLGARLKYARTLVPGLTTEELGSRATLAGSAIRMIESDKVSDCKLSTITRIAKALHIEAGWLAFGTGEQPDERQVNAAMRAAG